LSPSKFVSINDFCSALYCGFVNDHELAPTSGQIRFTARVMDGMSEEYYRVECDGVRDFVRRSESPAPSEPDDRTELSVVELKGEPGKWCLWFNPFYRHEIEFGCDVIRINGSEVRGKGGRLQDELPASRPQLPPHPSRAT
jgi:hypothetical protein